MYKYRGEVETNNFVMVDDIILVALGGLQTTLTNAYSNIRSAQKAKRGLRIFNLKIMFFVCIQKNKI